MRISLRSFSPFPPFCWTTEGLSVGLQKEVLLDYRRRFCWITPPQLYKGFIPTLGGFYPNSGRILSQSLGGFYRLLSQVWEGSIPTLRRVVSQLWEGGRLLSQFWEGFIPSLGGFIPTLGGFYPNSGRVLSQVWEGSIPTLEGLGGFYPNSGRILSQLQPKGLFLKRRDATGMRFFEHGDANF